MLDEWKINIKSIEIKIIAFVTKKKRMKQPEKNRNNHNIVKKSFLICIIFIK